MYSSPAILFIQVLLIFMANLVFQEIVTNSKIDFIPKCRTGVCATWDGQGIAIIKFIKL